MIPKKPAPDLIRGGYRFSEKIMLKQRSRTAGWRFEAVASSRRYQMTRYILPLVQAPAPSEGDQAAFEDCK